MLHPVNNRLDYGQLLMPPDDYTLTKAIGTTYSLDLNALMIMPVAMFYSQSIDRPKNEIRVDMVDAIIKASDKIDVYYQQGKLHVPKKYHYLMAFWEKGLHEVRMPHHAASFHPKVWICRFDADDRPTIYRLIVTSRNLTFASDYDIAFASEGVVGKSKNRHNQPLIDFLLHLNSIASTANEAFLEGLRYVNFDVPEKFEDLRFHPVGTPLAKGKYTNPIQEYSWQELLAISPFIDDATVDSLSKATEKPVLLMSTQEELSCLRKDVIGAVHPWQFSKFIEETADNEEVAENEEEPLPQSLHAKMFVATAGNQPYWYLGSANCTAPAQHRNIEFLIELRAIGRGCKPKDVLHLLTNTTDKTAVPIFEPFQSCSAEELQKQKNVTIQVRSILYDLFAIKVQTDLVKNEQTILYTYRLDLNLTHFRLPDGFRIDIRPVSNPNEVVVTLKPGQQQWVNSFKDYTEALLTPYFAVSIHYEDEYIAEATWCLQIELPHTRLNKIFTAIINSRERFMEYLFFLLSGDQAGVLDSDESTEKRQGAGTSNLFDGKPLFENLLIAASRDTDKLKNIRDIILRLVAEDEDNPEQQKIISQEFLQFWNVFDQYLTKTVTYA